MNPTLKRYIISSVTTFLSTFLIFIGFAIGHVPAEQAISGSLLLGIAGAGFRAAVKGVVEALAGQHADA